MIWYSGHSLWTRRNWRSVISNRILYVTLSTVVLTKHVLSTCILCAVIIICGTLQLACAHCIIHSAQERECDMDLATAESMLCFFIPLTMDSSACSAMHIRIYKVMHFQGSLSLDSLCIYIWPWIHCSPSWSLTERSYNSQNIQWYSKCYMPSKKWCFMRLPVLLLKVLTIPRPEQTFSVLQRLKTSILSPALCHHLTESCKNCYMYLKVKGQNSWTVGNR